jgi:hypothetical protein
MPVAPLRLIKRCFEFAPQADVDEVPDGLRGMYVLYRYRRPRSGVGGSKARFNVVYVGIARAGRGGIRRRLLAHRKNKGAEWTHFSILEVHDNIRNDEVEELEGLFRHIYRFDGQANRLNVLRQYLPLDQVRKASEASGDWMGEARSDLPRRERP